MTITNVKMRLNPNYDPIVKADLSCAESRLKELLESEKRTILEIGKWLKHVKDNNLTHGNWLPWLSSMGFAVRTAQNYMKVYDRFGNTSVSTHLSAGKLLEMLQLPDSINIGEFVARIHTLPSGTRKSVSSMTTEEVRQTVKKERERLGLITRTPKGSVSTKLLGATPFLRRMIKGLSKLISPIAIMYEQGVIDVEDAVDIGNEFDESKQSIISSILNEHDYQVEWVVEVVRLGLTKTHVDTIRQLEEEVDEINSMYGSNSRVKVGLSFIEGEFSRVFNELSSLSQLSEITRSIKEQLNNLREQGEQDKRAQEQQSWGSAFGFLKYTEAFRTMELNYGATQAEVRRKWRELTKKYHPDNLDTGDEDTFKRIASAHEDIKEYHRGVAS